MILERYHIDQIRDVYIELYKRVFPDEPINYPADVYIGSNGTREVGFASGYALDPYTWYLQRAGFIPEEQNKTWVIAWYNLLLEQLHQDWPTILTLVLNTNIRALKLDMAMGFRIIGTRMDTAKNLWVELLRVKEN